MKKYEFTSETKEFSGVTLHRTRALVDFGDVKSGDLGGWIEKEENLSHEDNAWVCENACVSGNAWVCENALVYGNAWVCGNTLVYGDAWVYDDALVYGNAIVFGNAHVFDDAFIKKDARIGKNAVITCKDDWFCVDNVGSRHDTVTFYKGTDGIYVCTGCFNDTLDAFVQAVKEIHGDNHFAKEYNYLANFAKFFINGGKNVLLD